jgi:hypothetical protein
MRDGFSHHATGGRGVFDISSLESPAERWRQLFLLVIGVVSIWLGHEVATWASDPSTTSVRLCTAAVVVFGLIQVARSISQFAASVSSRQARVFRWRHLAACGLFLLSVAVALIISLLVWDPLSSLLSRGRITGDDIADVGFALAAGLCLAGAIIAFIAAAAEHRSEQDWKHSTFTPPGGW